MNYPNLFSPIKINGLELKNRIVMPAMGTFMTDGNPNERMTAYFVARAKGGCGMITPEATSVYAPGAPCNFLNLSEDKFVTTFQKMNEEIHAAGAKTCAQLWQGGLTPMFFDPKCIPILPSEMLIDWVMYAPNPNPFTVPAASIETIKEVEAAFGHAARRAVESGFNAVEFHLAHGYMPHMFLSAGFNKRTDEYGGSFENRALFPLNCIREIRKNIPDEMPLIIRIDACDDYVENGLTIEDVIAFLKMAKEEGADAVNVSRGNPVSIGMKYEVPAIEIPRGFNVENAARIKAETGLITIATGRINTPEQAEEIIAAGKADMVVMGRAQLADQEFCNKARTGISDEIVRCVGCGQGCGGSGDVPYFTCTFNPTVGKETEIAITPTDKPKKVVVVGGGLAGLEAALILKQRGHMPIILEETNRLGGQFILAGLAPHKEEMKQAAESFAHRAKKAEIDIRMLTKGTPELLKELNPDEVIIATGASPLVFNVPGADGENVCNWKEVLEGKKKLEGKVVVIGGGLVGLEVAEALTDDGCNVTVVEMLENAGNGLASSRMVCVNEMISQKGISIMTNTKCVEITPNAVVVEKDGKKEEISCNGAVFAVGSKSNDYSDLKQYCEKSSIPFHIVGDAVKTRKVINAIHEAFFVALDI